MAAKPIPDGFHTITPHLICRNAAQAIEFYKKAFGAEEIMRMPDPSGKIMHAELRIGDSVLMMAEEFPEWGCRSPQALSGSPVTVHLYVKDCDAVYQRAIAAGATAAMPLQDMFWGDRYGKLKDPFGHEWSVSTHKEDLTPEQIGQRAAAAFGGGGCKPS